MRFITRLYTCFAATVIFVLYFNWIRPSAYIQDSIQDNINRVWKQHAHRLVVFGDDWSDTGVYRVASPPSGTTRDRDPHQGKLWTETLCKELNCDYIDNYARSSPATSKTSAVGSMVDADIFANATGNARDEPFMSFDFQAQVQQFISYEKKRKHLPAPLRPSDQSTVFTVLFGIWDLLAYSPLDQEVGIQAINRSVAELVHNLDILAAHVDGPLKVVVPSVLDVTFLPRFSSRRNESTDMYAMDHHQAVFMWHYWNSVLFQAAEAWDKGDLFMPDLHGIVMDQVRNHQLYYNQISDADGFGTQAPLFYDVEQPCISRNYTSGLQAPAVDKCPEPSRHLFWDDMHLSGPVHKLIGKEAARLVHGNATLNFDARERALQRDSPNAAHGAERQGADFGLRFPPAS
ncbi:hypothetical protein DM02DRAFT_513127 [Periconia macrospinosa]|uniref:Carbohydrate esterase family 16 protein n=1 Tax=Periconia macrospinosa TaxID=97972 RepID=A0A2V1EC49_9PLEO|nr:hypothetical protein DM02DRAFT_513127 [Periconia macrospinosa]